jgi:chromate transporter
MMHEESARRDSSAIAPLPGLAQLFTAFAKLAVTSFGGGLSGWIMHECVRRRRWLSEDEFLRGLAMAQALPGVNVVNLPIWIGYRLRGGAGAVASALGMVLPAMVVICLVASLFETVSSYAGVHLAMQGAAAAAIGLMLSMGLKAARRQLPQVTPAAVMVAAFLGVSVLKLSMPLVVGILAPVSIAIAWRRIRFDA